MYSTREFIVAACFDLEGKQTKRTIDSKPFYFFGKFFKKKRGTQIEFFRIPTSPN
jgi:hypothetical protein